MAQRRQKASQKSRARSPQQTVASLRRTLTGERHQRRAAIEQQQATAEILKVISESPTDIRPVFQAIAERAARLCEAGDAQVFVVNGEKLELVAHSGKVAQAAPSQKIEPGWATGRAVMERAPVQVKDVLALPREFPTSQITSKPQGVRTVLALPLMLKGVAVGAITLRRREVRPFSDKQIALLKTFADQAVIAIENTRLFNETKEALDQQTATADVLKVISSSPNDVQPVFDTIIRNAARLGNAPFGFLISYEGQLMRLAASYNTDAETEAIYRPVFPRVADRGTWTGRALLDCEVINLSEISESDFSEGSKERARKAGFRSILAVPMLRGGTPIGVIAINKREPGAFSDAYVALLRTFADQAVIAIENVRLFNETKESLERQTATGEILASISGSVSDTRPVFDAIVRNLLRLFDTRYATVVLLREGQLDLAALHGEPGYEWVAGGFPRPLDDSNISGGAMLTGKVLQVAPCIGNPATPPRTAEIARKVGFNSIVAAPMIREGKVIGAITTARRDAVPFDDKQVGLIQSFADQAVIAIENARLFNETKDALEQQTATAQILRVISSSPNDIQPVFDSIVEHAMRLCDAGLGTVGLYDGKSYKHVAQRGGSPEYTEWLFRESFEPGPGSTLGVMIAERRPVHIADYRALASYREGNARAVATAELGGARTYLAVPMIKEGEVIGGITIRRAEVRPFTQKQIDLVSTFASQGVIAIENVRLFNETKEALEQQTATADILRVIASSPASVQPVFDAILDKATDLCEAQLGLLFLLSGATWRMVSHRGASPEAQESHRSFQAGPNTGLGRMLREGKPVHIEDLIADAATTHRDPLRVATIEKLGARTFLAVPLLKDGTVIGGVVIYRQEVRPFGEAQIRLLSTFADQAVIAIENVRLFNETKEALEQQTATSEILRVISSSPADLQPVFAAIARNFTTLCGAVFGSVYTVADGLVHYRASAGVTPEQERAHSAKYPVRIDDPSVISARAVFTRAVVHVDDALSDPHYDPQRAKILGVRRIVGVPMLRDGVPLGSMVGGWREPGATPKQHENLLKTFADQAVIAIENTRLFNETKEALEQQTATARILGVMSSSPTDVQPVLDAVAESAARLCETDDAIIRRVESGGLRRVAHFGPLPATPETEVHPIVAGSVGGRAVLERRHIHVEDIEEEVRQGRYPEAPVLAAAAGWYRSMLAMPLVREETAIGVIMIRRKEFRPFTDKQIALLKTFADQAVIAIENVRLFNETKEALERQTSISDILRVIAGSPANIKPVLQAVAEAAGRLCKASDVFIRLVQGEQMPSVVHVGEIPLPESTKTQRISLGTAAGRAILECRSIHIADTADPAVRAQFPDAIFPTQTDQFRSLLVTPLVHEQRAIGTITIRRMEKGQFSEAQIKLMQAFADQAVIAIENARLFREIQEKSAELEAVNRRLEVADKHKSEFLANMSHELRTPLNAIIGFSEAMMEQMFGELNEKQLDYQKDINESGKHLLSLINDILDLSKIEAGRMELELSSFHLPTAVSNAVALIRERAHRHGIALGVQIDERLGEFQADERKVKQILLNLLSNAVKFTPDGGRVDVSANLDTDNVEIAVKDSGVGMTPEDQVSLFEEFRQLGKDSSRKAEGTGLGLALTKKFVELHGGAMRVESAPGKGSTFMFSLPLRSS